jgi:hypothetical protein
LVDVFIDFSDGGSLHREERDFTTPTRTVVACVEEINNAVSRSVFSPTVKNEHAPPHARGCKRALLAKVC